MAATQSEENPVDSKHRLNKRLCFIVLLNGACVPASSANARVEINGRHQTMLHDDPLISKNSLLTEDPMNCLYGVPQNYKAPK